MRVQPTRLPVRRFKVEPQQSVTIYCGEYTAELPDGIKVLYTGGTVMCTIGMREYGPPLTFQAITGGAG